MATLGDKLMAIRQAIENGASSVKEIAELTGFHRNVIYNCSYKHGINLPKRNYSSINKRLSAIRKAITTGALSIDEIARQVGLSSKTVCEYSSKYNILLPQDSLNVKQQKLERQKEKQLERETKSQFLFKLKECLYKKVGEEGWAMQKAVEALYARNRRTYKLQDIYAIFQKYERAQREGKKLSLEELAEGTPFLFVDVGRLLREIGVEPMHGNLDKKATSQWKKQSIDKAYEKVSISTYDIAHFIDVNPQVVRKRFCKKGKRENIQTIKDWGKQKLTYRLASQIYETVDLGFNQSETAELLDANPKVVEYALSERKGLEPTIINALQVLYPQETITKPYRT